MRVRINCGETLCVRVRINCMWYVCSVKVEVISQAKLSLEKRIWSNSHHHLISNTPRISWHVNGVSDDRGVQLPLLFREPLLNTFQFMFTPTSLDALLLSMQYKSLMGI